MVPGKIEHEPQGYLFFLVAKYGRIKVDGSIGGFLVVSPKRIGYLFRFHWWILGERQDLNY